MNRLTFLSHFVICLAVAAAAFFAWMNGVFAAVWAGDASHMTSVIGALFVGAAAWLGREAWRADEPSAPIGFDLRGAMIMGRQADASFGHLAERVLPMLGLFGTAFGLSLQAKALMSGSAAFGPLSTSLYCTAFGVLGALIVAVMTYSLEAGMRRVTR